MKHYRITTSEGNFVHEGLGLTPAHSLLLAVRKHRQQKSLCPGCGETKAAQESRDFNGVKDNGLTAICPDCQALYHGFSLKQIAGESILWRQETIDTLVWHDPDGNSGTMLGM